MIALIRGYKLMITNTKMAGKMYLYGSLSAFFLPSNGRVFVRFMKPNSLSEFLGKRGT
jgi:hypothetical protein